MNRQERLRSLFQTTFSPQHLDVVDESHMHSRGQETHYKIVLVSAMFEGKSRVERHQMVNGLLKDEMAQGLHAITLRALTPEEWSSPNTADFNSPACRHYR